MASIGQGTETEVQDIEYMLWAGTIVTVVSATVAVGLRFLSRYIAKAKLWWDDWVIVVSLIINWTMAITRWMQVLKFSFGKHGSDISTSDIVAYQKSFMAIQLLYFTNAVLTKSSLLLLYQRIFSIVPSYRWAIRFSWFLILSYFISCVIASIAACSPPSYVWNRFRDGNGYGGPDAQDGSCFNEIAFFRWNGIANMLLDVLMLVLPIPMVWRLRAPRRVKVLLSGVFGLGGLYVFILSILSMCMRRLPPPYRLLRYLGSQRPDLHADPIVDVVVCRAGDWDCVCLFADAEAFTEALEGEEL
ncbi:hypothetical protein BJX76DRAFT_359303 [Aspergillus varians]